MTGPLRVLRIEVDGHFHGSPNVPRPWVAEIGGPDPKYGLQRKFVDAMNDWKDAHRAQSGNLYGIVATFALREGRVYEVSRCKGKSSKRYVAREFLRIEGNKRVAMTTEELLAHVDGAGDGVLHRLADPGRDAGRDAASPSSASEITGLGQPTPIAFVVDGAQRLYRLREGRVYETIEGGRRQLLGVRGGVVQPLTQQEAWTWLT